MPDGCQQREGNADNEEVVGIGEESHARGNHRFPVKACKRTFIECSQNRVSG